MQWKKKHTERIERKICFFQVPLTNNRNIELECSPLDAFDQFLGCSNVP